MSPSDLDAFISMLSGNGATDRTQTVGKYGDDDLRITVNIHRRGKPNTDMSGVDVSKRWISIRLHKKGEAPREIHMSAQVAAAISTDLIKAATTIRKEGQT